MPFDLISYLYKIKWYLMDTFLFDLIQSLYTIKCNLAFSY